MNNNNNRGSNRRRGRGNNNRQQGGNQGNRIDSRARGNAPQMLEKYRKLAHDASLNGDRVQAEYYLQFADHYFRVIADSRSTKDEQRPAQQGNRDQGYDDEYGDEGDQYHRVLQNNGREGGRDAGRDGGRDGNREAGRDAGRDGGRENGRDRSNDARRDQSDREEGEANVEGEAFEPAENPFTRDTREARPGRSSGERGDGERGDGERSRGERSGRSRRPAPRAENADREQDDGELRFDPASLPPSFAAAAEPEERKPARKPRKPRVASGAASSTEGRDEKGGEELETVN